VRILTYLDQGNLSEFRRWKRRANGPWNFLASGEWSTLSGFSGTHRFYYNFSDDKLFWSLLSIGFPTRVIAATSARSELPIETVAGSMLRAVSAAGGDSVDCLDEVSEQLDHDLLWNTFLGK